MLDTYNPLFKLDGWGIHRHRMAINRSIDWIHNVSLCVPNGFQVAQYELFRGSSLHP
jgi:hypothetical protein